MINNLIIGGQKTLDIFTKEMNGLLAWESAQHY